MNIINPIIFLGTAHNYAGHGRRNDLEAVKASLLAGKSKRELYNDHFTEMVKYPTGIAKAAAVLCPRESSTAEYKLESFAEPPRRWQRIDARDLRSRLIILTGPSGIGKTQFALAHFNKPLMISHMDQLKQIETGEFDGVVFDDMSFFHMPREPRIHICDLAHDRAIHIRYDTALMPKFMPRILTTNKSYEEVMFKPDENHQDFAIKRRVKVIALTVDDYDDYIAGMDQASDEDE